VRFILRDFWPIKATSLVTRIYRLCPNSKLILYPHAYALYSCSSKYEEYVENKEKHDASCFDLFLSNTPLDLSYWSRKIPHDRIVQMGPFGYSQWWLSQLVEYNRNSSVFPKRNTGFSHCILFSFRGPNDGYLFSEDYDTLMKTALKVLFNMEDVYLYIKPHPRQKESEYLDYLKAYPEDRFTITFENSFIIADQIDLAVNFYTSVTTDLLAMKKPGIEYFYYKGGSSFWYNDKSGKATSIFAYLDITESISSEPVLEGRIRELLESSEARENLLQKQFNSFQKVYGNVELAGERFVKLLQEKDGVQSINKKEGKGSLFHWFRVLISTIKAKFKQIL